MVNNENITKASLTSVTIEGARLSTKQLAKLFRNACLTIDTLLPHLQRRVTASSMHCYDFRGRSNISQKFCENHESFPHDYGASEPSKTNNIMLHEKAKRTKILSNSKDLRAKRYNIIT
ncbi:hypothetical protein DINM_003715 [Dirofilaria immitis]|nr:hypothetical protein [Dirofilaria immitis]